MKKLKVIIFLNILLVSAFIQAQLSEKQIDKLVEESQKAFKVPGISVGIIDNGKVVYAKGHGVRSTTNQLPMTEETLVGIASNSKGFTGIALGMMVDEGKLNWDDKVQKYIPEFRMSIPFVSEEFTVRDLLIHRGGLTLGAGDLHFFPEGGDFTVDDVIANIGKLKPESSFRNKFRYNNNMYIIAGEVLRRISGLSWEEFIEQKILKPVGMKNSKAAWSRVDKKTANIIDAHAPVGDKIVQIPHDWSDLANPAGGIMSNIDDMLIWADFLINKGVTKDGKRLISEKQLHEIWSIQTPIHVRRNNDYNTHFYGYGLGYFLSDMNGHFQVRHGGGLIGTVTLFTLFPDKKLGIVVLTNQQSGAAMNAITNDIKDSYLGYENRNWVERYKKRTEKYLDRVQKEKDEVFSQIKSFSKSQKITKSKNITGTYKDAWLGEIYVEQKNNRLNISFKHQPQLIGELLPYTAQTYVAKWDNRSFDADSFVNFSFNETGKAVSFTMKPISSITDFSFDFVDIEAKREIKIEN